MTTPWFVFMILVLIIVSIWSVNGYMRWVYLFWDDLFYKKKPSETIMKLIFRDMEESFRWRHVPLVLFPLLIVGFPVLKLLSKSIYRKWKPSVRAFGLKKVLSSQKEDRLSYALAVTVSDYKSPYTLTSLRLRNGNLDKEVGDMKLSFTKNDLYSKPKECVETVTNYILEVSKHHKGILPEFLYCEDKRLKKTLTAYFEKQNLNIPFYVE